tara:strand:- start:767 stop:1543 length:777 start_codon:yes stop_codon:yes gene_type:complete
VKFKEDLKSLLIKMKSKENFAFTRFSDGEICIMQNKELKLATDHVIMGQTTYNFGYSDDDYKHFEPEKHSFLKDKLIEAYTYKKKNYFVGGICKGCSCASREFATWMHDLYGELDENLTSTNLLVNSNYPLFIKYFVPILQNRKVVLICSQNADLSKTKLNIVKDFRVGKNCIVNDHHLVDDIKKWIVKEDIKDHIFLFSASSLSEVLIHELFKDHDENTYIDIGTTLHPYIGLTIERDYLKSFWSNLPHPDLFKSCV